MVPWPEVSVVYYNYKIPMLERFLRNNRREKKRRLSHTSLVPAWIFFAAGTVTITLLLAAGCGGMQPPNETALQATAQALSQTEATDTFIEAHNITREQFETVQPSIGILQMGGESFLSETGLLCTAAAFAWDENFIYLATAQHCIRPDAAIMYFESGDISVRALTSAFTVATDPAIDQAVIRIQRTSSAAQIYIEPSAQPITSKQQALIFPGETLLAVGYPESLTNTTQTIRYTLAEFLTVQSNQSSTSFPLMQFAKGLAGTRASGSPVFELDEATSTLIFVAIVSSNRQLVVTSGGTQVPPEVTFFALDLNELIAKLPPVTDL